MNLIEVVEALAPELKKNRHIHAMWLEGSYATGKFNDQSDIDVWLDVDDDSFDDVFASFAQHLEKVGKIDREESRGVYSKEPKLAKRAYHLEGFSREQTIELDLQQHSRNFVFSKKDHILKALFDKDQTIKWQ